MVTIHNLLLVPLSGNNQENIQVTTTYISNPTDYSNHRETENARRIGYRSAMASRSVRCGHGQHPKA